MNYYQLKYYIYKLWWRGDCLHDIDSPFIAPIYQALFPLQNNIAFTFYLINLFHHFTMGKFLDFTQYSGRIAEYFGLSIIQCKDLKQCPNNITSKLIIINSICRSDCEMVQQILLSYNILIIKDSYSTQCINYPTRGFAMIRSVSCTLILFDYRLHTSIDKHLSMKKLNWKLGLFR